MNVYAPRADASVEAFQWVGDPLSDYGLPGWAVGAHAPSDNTLHVPCWNGTFGARIGDWIVRDRLGNVSVVSNDIFAASYDVEHGAEEATPQTAAEQRAAARAKLHAKKD